MLLVRIAAALTLCVGIVAVGRAGHRLLADETSQARALVAEGQGAMARGDRGAGVLSLERARWLAPRAGLVRTALAAAGVKDAESVLPRTLRLVTSPEWSAIAVGAGWVSGLGMAFAVLRWRRRSAAWVALATGLVFCGAMAASVETGTSSPAIVTGTDARILVAPYPSAAVEAPLGEGTMVMVGSPYDDFVHVDDGGGTTGWVRQSSVERIASPGS
jgi:hypothetical protein